jgi:hypothetical protein
MAMNTATRAKDLPENMERDVVDPCELRLGAQRTDSEGYAHKIVS